jgi:HlyD family secretion protein
MAHSVSQTTSRSIRRCLVAGATLTALLTIGVGGWAANTQLAGAVIAPGSLVVDSSVKKVQHPTGGVVGELRVRDGTEVKANDVLLRLDETVTRSNLTGIVKSMDELMARQVRLRAEQDDREKVVFPDELDARSADPAIAELLAGEARFFETRRTGRAGQKAQLNKRIDQLLEQINGMGQQITAKEREIDLIGQELEGVRDLWQKKLVPITRVNALERDEARLNGERGTLVSEIAQSKGRITEIELQILQIGQDMRTEVGKDLAEIRSKLAELVEKRIAAEDQLKRVEIRSPQDGVVHQLSVHTVGGVISPGELIMLIVPKSDALTVEARIAPQDVDQVRIGQSAVLRFSAFNQRTTPELNGSVSLVSADVSQDAKSGANFYTVRISLASGELARLNGLKLVPGMPVDSFIQTGERTVMSYLVKPLNDQIVKTWREK